MYGLFKRLFDIIVSFILLIILSPLLIPIALVLKFTGEGDIWYFQKRLGMHNQYFSIFKFATMLRDSPNMLTGSLTLRDDPRVTTVGKYLRSTKINELPQLINVLKGDMSLVGPRPQMQEDFNAYPDDIQKKIYNIRPGITGIGSIVFRDEEKMISSTEMDPRDFYNDIIAPYKGKLELWYQEKMNAWLDFKILVVTFLVVIFPDVKISRFFPELPKAPTVLQSYF